VESLPEVGNPAVVFDSNLSPTFIDVYYALNENLAYGYVNEELSAAGGGIPAGWYPVENLFPLINVDYEGIIHSKGAASSTGLYLLVEFDLYSYKNGQFKSISVSEEESYNWKNNHEFNGDTTFKGEVKFNSQSSVTFSGGVDFSGAMVTGLASSNSGSGSTAGGGLTKRKVTLEELQALLINENMGMLVSVVCKNSVKRDYNGVIAPMLKIGYSTLSTSAPEVFNRNIYSIIESYYNGAPVIQFNEYLLRILKTGVVFNHYTYRINKSTLEYSSYNESLKDDFTNANFDFYVYS
jgi:hypothetical protein